MAQGKSKRQNGPEAAKDLSPRPTGDGLTPLRAAMTLTLCLALLVLGSCSPGQRHYDNPYEGVWQLPNEPRERPAKPAVDQEDETQHAARPVTRSPGSSEETLPTGRSEIPSRAGAPPLPQPVSGHQVLNFNRAPLVDVIKVLADMLRINVIIDPSVKGWVTLHSGGEVDSRELMPMLDTICQLNKAALVREGPLFRVVPSTQARQAPLSPQLAGPRAVEQREGYGLDIFYLKHLPAQEAAKIIKPFLGDGAQEVAMTPANLLIVADSGANLRKLSRLVSLIDQPLSDRVRIKIYPVEHVDVKNLGKDLRTIFQALGIPTKPSAGVWVELVPLPDMNSLAVISTFRETFRTVEQWLLDMDRQIADNEIGVFVYYCQNADAQSIADVLTGLFGTGKSGVGTRRTGTSPSLTSSLTGAPGLDLNSSGGSPLDSAMGVNQSGTLGGNLTGRPTRAERDAMRSVGSTNQQNDEVGPRQELEGGVRFVVDSPNNAIVIRAPRKEIQSLLRTIRKLDAFPKQVLIEVLITEITLDGSLNLGVEWQTSGTMSGGTFVDATLSTAAALVPTSGLVYAISKTNQIQATLRALAKEGKLQVVSSPLLLTADNTASNISVGQEVPVVTTITTSEDLSTGEGRKIVDRSIQYRSTGIILSVLPRINDSGLVRLNIDQEVSNISEVSFGSTDSPSFFKRAASTKVVTIDGQTVVIGGLISNDLSDEESGIPFLMDIPILGQLFKAEETTRRRTELIITLTPHVIHDMADARQIVAEFREQMLRLQAEQGPDSWQNLSWRKLRSLTQVPSFLPSDRGEEAAPDAPTGSRGATAPAAPPIPAAPASPGGAR